MLRTSVVLALGRGITFSNETSHLIFASRDFLGELQ